MGTFLTSYKGTFSQSRDSPALSGAIPAIYRNPMMDGLIVDLPSRIWILSRYVSEIHLLASSMRGNS